MDIWISIIVTFLLVLVNGYFSMSEMALVNAKLVLLQHEAEAGDKRAERAYSLASDSSQFWQPSKWPSRWSAFSPRPPLPRTCPSLWFVVCQLQRGVAYGYCARLGSRGHHAGGVVPQHRGGRTCPEAHCPCRCGGHEQSGGGPAYGVRKIASPLVTLTSASANGLSKLLRVKNADERQTVSEEEIKYMVTDNDELLEDEKRMIHDILDLGDMTVHEIMTRAWT